MNITNELESKDWMVMQEWFGMGGGYEVLDVNKETTEIDYNFAGLYDPNALRIMNQWESGGLGAWLPEEALIGRGNEGESVNVNEMIKDIWNEIDKMESQEINVTTKNNCEKLLYGEKGMFEEMNMEEFIEAIEVIQNFEDSLDIKKELANVIDDMAG